MKTIHVNQKLNQPLLNQINDHLKGRLTGSEREQKLLFNNDLGKGNLQEYSIDRALRALSFEVYFSETTKFIFTNTNSHPLDFIYVLDGEIEFVPDNLKNQSFTLHAYQNIIIRNKPQFNNTFVIPKKTKVRFYIIETLNNDLIANNNISVNHLDEKLKTVLVNEHDDSPLIHVGNYNLKIKDLVDEVCNFENKAVQTLIMKGKVYLIIAEQLAEYKKYIDKLGVPNYITPQDLTNLKTITEDITDNLNEFQSIANLCKKHGYNQPKLQTMFKMFYDKTINEFIKQKKMEVARDLIENTNLSISEIVFQIGYRSRSYFSKLFYEFYGILPMQFRDKCKREKDLAQSKNG